MYQSNTHMINKQLWIIARDDEFILVINYITHDSNPLEVVSVQKTQFQTFSCENVWFKDFLSCDCFQRS